MTASQPHGLRLRPADGDSALFAAQPFVDVGVEAPLRIGRSVDNDWVIGRKSVSRHQAVLWHVNGRWFLENRSDKCPIYVRQPDRALRTHDCDTLQPGDSFWIDDIEVRVDAAPDEAAGSDGLQVGDVQRNDVGSVQHVDVLQLLLQGSRAEPPPHGDGANGSAMDPNWWQDPAGQSPAERLDAGDEAITLLRALCCGAEIDPRDLKLTPEVMTGVGQLLRETVVGVQRLLQARQAVRNELRLERTRLHAIANNPFKCSPEEAQVMRQLLRPADTSSLSPGIATARVFDDLLDHQVALVEGLRIAFDQLLRTLSPDRFEAAASQASLLERLIRPQSTRAWRAYRALHARWLEDPDDGYRQLIGNALAQGYEAQCDRLKRIRTPARQEVR
jgi:predicted component of type VI protein secretion system